MSHFCWSHPIELHYAVRCSRCRPTNLSFSLTRPHLSRFGFRTEEPNSVSRSEPLRRFWVWCRATGLCWEACTSSRPAWLDSTTPSPWPISPASLPCCPLGRTPGTQAQLASAPAPVSQHSRPPSASMTTGIARCGATSPHPCSHWPPCSLLTPPLTGVKF